MSANKYSKYSPTPLTKYFSDDAVIEELAKTSLLLFFSIFYMTMSSIREREFDFLCNFLHGVSMCNSASADRIHDACKLLKEVDKIDSVC